MLETLLSCPVRTALLLLVALEAGDCYATKFPLASPDRGKVDAAFRGKWQSQDGKDRVLFANFNDHQYFVMQTGEDNKPHPYAGFILDVTGAHFPHLAPT